MVRDMDFTAAAVRRVDDGLARRPEVLRQAVAAGVTRQTRATGRTAHL
jgi:hypothetical protein